MLLVTLPNGDIKQMSQMPKNKTKKNLNFDSFTVLESLCLLHCAFFLSLYL